MTHPVHKLLFASAIVFVVLINLPIQAQNTDQTTVMDVLAAENGADSPAFTILLQALEITDFADVLADPNLRFMLFAPTDTAFEAYFETAATDLETLLTSPDALSALLAYHISTEPVTVEELSTQTSVTTLAGLSITIKTPGTDILLNNRVSLSGTSYLADNGIIHTLNTVLVRPRNSVDSSEPDITVTPTPEGDDTDSDDSEDDIVSATATPLTDDLDADTALFPEEDDSPATDTAANGTTTEAAAEDSEDSNTAQPTEEAEDVAVTATPSSEPTLPQNGDGECIVFIEVEEQADVRVGPGNNRTGITFLDVDVEYTVIAYSIDERNVIWYQLDREEAAPNRAIDEAWVSSEEVSTDGDCTDLDFNEGTPVIPIDDDDTAEG